MSHSVVVATSVGDTLQDAADLYVSILWGKRDLTVTESGFTLDGEMYSATRDGDLWTFRRHCSPPLPQSRFIHFEKEAE